MLDDTKAILSFTEKVHIKLNFVKTWQKALSFVTLNKTVHNSKQISKLDIIDKMKVILCPFPRNVLCLHNISSWCQIIIHWAAVGNMIKLLVPLNMHWIFPPWSVFIITYHNIDNRGLSSPNFAAMCYNKTWFKQLLRLFKGWWHQMAFISGPAHLLVITI